MQLVNITFDKICDEDISMFVEELKSILIDMYYLNDETRVPDIANLKITYSE